MIGESAVWLIFFLPLASFIIVALVIRPFFNRYAEAAGYLTILAVGASFVLSLYALGSVINQGGRIDYPDHSWLEIGDFDFAIGILLDPLTAIMLVVVTSVSLMVQIYSTGYMRSHHGERDPGYARYFAYMSLFTASMLGLVLASNVIQLFVFWELVGLCSYLLIGFWYHRPAAAAAAKKAFIVTRVGDFGFLLAILYLFFHSGDFAARGLNPFLISHLYEAVEGGVIAAGVATLIAAGLFAGAVGKSGQFPLHTWLPDAMEGPTPVSALIHAATMVAAGVFLVARFFPLFEASPAMLDAVAIIGGVTAIFAASMGLVMNDIKRVLAYSTISQLGYMMLALGVGAYVPAMFHLFTHAFFKALLFLGSGSVNHATGTFDMRYMGGLRKAMPWTYITFLIGSLSLAGIFPLAGFWSKDEVLAHAFGRGETISQLVFWLALIAVFMTAFYMFRALFMTFEGEYRGGAEAEATSPPVPLSAGGEGGVAHAHASPSGHGDAAASHHASPSVHGGETESSRSHLSESPLVMAAPLVVLGIASALCGFMVNPVGISLGVIPMHWFTEFLGHGPVDVHAEGFNVGIAILSSAVALAGIGLAYVMYYSRRVLPERVGQRLRPAYVLLSRKYYFDELYEDVIVRRAFYGSSARALDWIDKNIIDRIFNVTGWLGANIGGALRQLQTGQLQGYGAVISVGILVIIGIYLFFK
jgi:NADH-quinone oxidoreductase subunit L